MLALMTRQLQTRAKDSIFIVNQKYSDIISNTRAITNFNLKKIKFKIYRYDPLKQSKYEKSSTLECPLAKMYACDNGV